MDATLVAEKRTDKGKNQARRHRAAGRLPAVVYGPGTGGKADQAIPVTVDPKALSKILHSESGANTIISLQLDGASVPVLVKDFLLQPVSHALLHADFYRVAMDRKLTVKVPVTITGEAKGVKQQGGVLDFVTREFEIEVLPADIPESIEVDVTELLMNQGVRIRDVAQGAKWTPVSEPETMLVHVVPMRVEEAPAATDAAVAPVAAAEPEVIKKGKTDKDEEKDRREEGLKLVVGLGNPGKPYHGTRHNVGFLVIDEAARRAGVSCDREALGALVGKAHAPVPMLLAKPLTFMNLSGQAVRALADFHKVERRRPAGGRRRREPAAGPAARAARRIGGRPQRVQVGRPAPGHRPVPAAADRRGARRRSPRSGRPRAGQVRPGRASGD